MSSAIAEDIIINLDANTVYVDVVINVDTTTAYTITTTTGPRFEVVDSVTVERHAWVDSWIWLFRGVADSTTVNAIAADDDSNSTSNNYWASRLVGIATPDTYTIRATSFEYVTARERPIGTYTLSSNLIPHIDTATVVVETVTTIIDTPTVIPVITPVPEIATPSLPIGPVSLPADHELIIEIVEVVPVVEPQIEELIEPVLNIPEQIDQIPESIETPIVQEVVIDEPTPIEEVIEEIIQIKDVVVADLPPDTPVQLENGVVITAAVVVALDLFNNPTELLTEIFTNPAEVFTAISNIGADMSDQERTESEKTIIASVIAGQAAINAAGIATTAKGPVNTGGPNNNNIKLLRRKKL
jgi:hypothetical protein